MRYTPWNFLRKFTSEKDGLLHSKGHESSTEKPLEFSGVNWLLVLRRGYDPWIDVPPGNLTLGVNVFVPFKTVIFLGEHSFMFGGEEWLSHGSFILKELIFSPRFCFFLPFVWKKHPPSSLSGGKLALPSLKHSSWWLNQPPWKKWGDQIGSSSPK